MSGSDFIFTNIIIIIYTADLPIFQLASHLNKFLINCLHKNVKSDHNRNEIMLVMFYQELISRNGMVMQTADQTLVQQRMENQPTLMEIVPQSSNPSVSIHQQQVSAATNIHCKSYFIYHKT